MLLSLSTPENLTIIAASIAAYAVANYFGVGEIATAVAIVGGLATTGVEGVNACNEMGQAFVGINNAKSEGELKEAARHLSGAFIHGFTAGTSLVLSGKGVIKQVGALKARLSPAVETTTTTTPAAAKPLAKTASTAAPKKSAPTNATTTPSAWTNLAAMVKSLTPRQRQEMIQALDKGRHRPDDVFYIKVPPNAINRSVTPPTIRLKTGEVTALSKYQNEAVYHGNETLPVVGVRLKELMQRGLPITTGRTDKVLYVNAPSGSPSQFEIPFENPAP
jgi:hypothetical protein